MLLVVAVLVASPDAEEPLELDEAERKALEGFGSLAKQIQAIATGYKEHTSPDPRVELRPTPEDSDDDMGDEATRASKAARQKPPLPEPPNPLHSILCGS